jgi:dTMP kinase
VNRRKGRFIVLEGLDKSGKSTQARLLVEALRSAGHQVLHTREPGGSPVAESLRQVLLNPDLHIQPLTELFLYAASRAQHTAETIRPALDAGQVVLCERYTLSTDVYQGLARGLGLRVTRTVNAAATAGLRPDLTIVLDVPVGEFDKRDRERSLDRLERENSDFRRKIMAGYRRLARQAPKTALIDGQRPVAEIQADIMTRVRRILP